MGNHNPKKEEYLILFMRHRKSIYAYILAMLCDVHLAEDLLQETALFAWEHFDDFEPGTNFVAWIRAISRYKVLDHCKRMKNKNFHLSDALLETIENGMSQKLATVDRRIETLQQCLQKLSPKQLQLLKYRYTQGHCPKEISKIIACTTNAVYKSLARTHNALKNCVQSKLKIWEVNL